MIYLVTARTLLRANSYFSSEERKPVQLLSAVGPLRIGNENDLLSSVCTVCLINAVVMKCIFHLVTRAQGAADSGCNDDFGARGFGRYMNSTVVVRIVTWLNDLMSV